MENIFNSVLNMSITASYVIIAVIIIRLFMRKLPKKYSYLLWSVVGFRLICPVSFKSMFSLFNLNLFNMSKAQSVTEHQLTYIPSTPSAQVTTGIPQLNMAMSTAYIPPEAAPTVNVFPILWIIGIIGLICYAVYTYKQLGYRMSTAVLREGNVYESDRVRSPFILGFVFPKIYIPFGLDDETLRYVLTHERYHIRRFDHIIKPFAFMLLTLHWFNPLCWAAFYLMGKDMEMSCDEKVLSTENGIRKIYSTSLLSFASNRRFPSPSPLAFGETGVKSRIKNVLNWKKPAVWISAVAVVICIAVLIACAANPAKLIDEENIISVVENGQTVTDDAKAALLKIINDSNSSFYPVGRDDSANPQQDRFAALNCADGSRYVMHYWYCSGFSFNPAHYGEDDYYSILTYYDADGNAKRAWKMEYGFDQKFLDWYDVHVRGVSRPFGMNYRVGEIVYDDGRFSFSYSTATAPKYSIDNNRVLRMDHGGGSVEVGELSEIQLTEENFDKYFIGSELINKDFSASQLRSDNEKAYRVDVETDNNYEMFYVLQQNNGDVFIGAGYYDPETDEMSDDSFFRWMFKLYEVPADYCIVTTRFESVPANHYPDGQFNFEYDELPVITVYGEDTLAFAVSWGDDVLTVGEDYYSYTPGHARIDQRTLELERDKSGYFLLPVERRNDYKDEYAVYFITNGVEKYVIKVLFPVDDVLEEAVPDFTESDVGGVDEPVGFEIISEADALIALHNNLVRTEDAIYFTIPPYKGSSQWKINISGRGEYESFGHSRHYYMDEEWVAGKKYDIPTENISELYMDVYLGNENLFIDMLAATADQLPSNTNVDTAIRNAVLEFNKPTDPDGLYHTESHVILDTQELSVTPPVGSNEHKNMLIVYAHVLYKAFGYSGGTFHDVLGSYIPTVITFDVSGDGALTLEEYWIPGDGSDYVSDIKEKFPKELHEDAIDGEKYILELNQAIYHEAVMYGRVDTESVIEALFETIESSPAYSSRPGDYIEAHPIDYRELTYYGNYTLEYVFRKFLDGDQHGLRGHLMASVMNYLIGDEAIDYYAETGQAYFDEWFDTVKNLYAENGANWMQLNMPNGWLLLKIADAV